MRGINIIGILVGVYLLWQSYQLVKNREESVFNFLLWLIVGSGLVIAGFFPSIFSYMIDALGMQERAFAMFAIGIFLAYLLLFRLFRGLQHLQTQLSQMNEEISLLQSDMQNKRASSTNRHNDLKDRA